MAARRRRRDDQRRRVAHLRGVAVADTHLDRRLQAAPAAATHARAVASEARTHAMVLFLKPAFSGHLAGVQAAGKERARLFSESSDVFRAITLSVRRFAVAPLTAHADRLALGKGSGFVTPLNEKLATRAAPTSSRRASYSIASITVLYEWPPTSSAPSPIGRRGGGEAEERRIEAGRQERGWRSGTSSRPPRP